KVLKKGLNFDRRWMLVDKNNLFMTQRVFPKMALFKPFFDGERLIIRFDSDQIELPADSSTNMLEAQIWSDMVTTYEVSYRHSQWFSERMGVNCKLVFFPEENTRPVDSLYAIDRDQTSLSDAFPFLIIGQRSLDDLNKRLDSPVPMNRFRPNFVFTGGQPYEEDTWKEMTIGNNRFVGVKRCSRCALTTVNQDTGEKGVEPLKTLSTYRTIENKTYFGQNLIALDYQTVNVGDIIKTCQAERS
ncbi:MAG TPA: MOSC domain-containing protein, partial [Cyclobacteriaceae bacterium]|nr:MOSC domain-containing protein [Cyclobacteriaceae bacterium]